MKHGTPLIEHGKCKIIAELGTLHHHSIDSLHKATEDCFNAGADAVKIQYIQPSEAFWAQQTGLDRYTRLYQSFTIQDCLNYLFHANQKYGKPVFCSTFSESTLLALSQVNPINKIASRVNQHIRLINIARSLGGPLILSRDDSHPAPEQTSGLINLYCPYLQYPLDLYKLRLPLMGEQYAYQGASLHTKDIDILRSVKSLGCLLLEVHVQGSDAEGPDTSFALTISELDELCQ